MRGFLGAAALFFFTLGPALAASGTAPATLAAQQIALYSDRSLLIAQGGVSLRVGTLSIESARAVYDLRANRYLASGDVRVQHGAAVQDFSGYEYDFATKRGSVSALPVPNLSTADALVLAQQATLIPGTSITFTDAQIQTGGTVTPSASYEYDIPAPNAKNFGYSPVPSAALEYPVLLGSSRNAYSFARLRYDRYNGGPGAGLEEHYARTNRGYLALGQTLDVDGGRFDLAAYQRITDSLSQSLTGSALTGARSLRYALTSSGAHGYQSLSFAQYNGTRSDDYLLQSLQRPFAHVASFRLQADLGHDVHPGDWPVAQDFRLTPGLHADSAALRIASATLTGSFDVGESLYDYGRATLASDANFFANIPFSARLLWNAGASFSHDAPPFPSTYRTFSLGSTWHPSDAFNLVSSLQYTHDYGQVFGGGRPEFSAAFDVRIRRKHGGGYEVGTIVPFGGLGDKSRAAALNFRFFK